MSNYDIFFEMTRPGWGRCNKCKVETMEKVLLFQQGLCSRCINSKDMLNMSFHVEWRRCHVCWRERDKKEINKNGALCDRCINGQPVTK